MAIYNLHNHTPYSDGAYSADEICEAHLNAGVAVAGVGISDHLFITPQSKIPADAREFERFFGAETSRYVEHVSACRERWAGRLTVLIGCEISWPLNRKFIDPIRALVHGMDYVLFEHCDWSGVTQLANQARGFPCRVGLAHTDVASQMPNTSMDQVVRTLANARIFYEVSTKFLPLAAGDPWYAHLARHRVMISLGTDTHDDLRVVRTLAELHGYVISRGLTEKLFTPRKQEAPVRVGEERVIRAS